MGYSHERAEAQPGRYELVDGEVFAQASKRVAHAKAKGAAYIALQDAVRRAGAPCHVLLDGVAVRVDASTVFEPDAQLYCGPELPPDTLLVESPLIVVEVLSPSTGRNDVLGKLEGYFRIASVAHYLIFDPDFAARHPSSPRAGRRYSDARHSRGRYRARSARPLLSALGHLRRSALNAPVSARTAPGERRG